MRKIIIPIIILITTILTSCAGIQTKSVYPVSQTDFVLDTVSKIDIYGGDISDPQKLLEETFDLCRHYENILSRTIHTSDVSKINNYDGEPVQVTKETAELIRLSIIYGGLSGGALDVTIEPVSRHWDFRSEEHVVPDKTLIEENLKYIDYRNITVNQDVVTLTNENTGIDLGAIAKGYIADKLKTYMVNNGVTNGIINLGGNILTIGGKSDNQDFTIGIQKPFDEQNRVIASVSVSDRSVVTSGIYERYFEIDGKQYHHILNPKTGYPVDNELASVTIISNTSVEGDALSTSCFVLGKKKGMNLINKLDNVDAVFITKDNEFVFSDGIGSDVKFEEIE